MSHPRDTTPPSRDKQVPSPWNTRGRLQHTIRLISLNLWLWELLGLLTSTLCIGAIICILSIFNGKPVPDWSYGLTVNGLVSILAGIAKASIVLPTAEAISQLKWYWFWNQQRPVVDFERYDSASRGPWGSLVLRCYPRLWNIVSLGAGLTIAAIAAEPSLQQIPILSLSTVATGNASVSRIISITGHENDGASNPILNMSMKGAVYSGIFDTELSNTAAIMPVWPTGNCTWPRFSSLGVCNACANITSRVFVSSTNPDYPVWTLPNGGIGSGLNQSISLLGGDSSAGWMVAGSWNSLAFDQKFANQSIIDLSFIYLPPVNATLLRDTNSTRANAAECVLWPCVKTYDAVMANGEYKETVTDIWPPVNATLSENPALKSMCNCTYREGCNELSPISQYSTCNVLIPRKLELRPPGDDTSYIYNLDSYNLLRNWLGFVLQLVYSSGYNTQFLMAQSRNDVPQAFYSTQLEHANATQAWEMRGPSAIMERVATSLTNHVRSAGAEEQSVAGTAFTAQNLVHARWEWAILPLVLLGLTVCFVVVTITLTARRGLPLWKSSSLAHVLHGLDDDSSDAMTANRSDQLESKAKGFTMKMDLELERWRLRGLRRQD
ncbi:uncharacterized protein CLAFUR5_03523 [Fulvia fulva]|uniref:Uncharacterized protein n=1 Tax=Passalora fulva TaxID=5499 RepID=A0A9Q8P503_PASFU|nr:uncharacterized protein CLAFUR5_03523 [Fulvia fulva]UJO13498.1 hypothetical protein CLAFUR5_03523 [Fulvia fulva]